MSEINKSVPAEQTNTTNNRPDSTKYNPDPFYLRHLIDRTGLSQREAARIIGVNERTLRNYLNPGRDDWKAPYPVQYALEMLLNVRLIATKNLQKGIYEKNHSHHGNEAGGQPDYRSIESEPFQ